MNLIRYFNSKVVYIVNIVNIWWKKFS